MMNKYPVCLGINVFDVTCFLERIIDELRDIVEHIYICLNPYHYQDNNPIPQEATDYCLHLLNTGKVDKILWADVSYINHSPIAECTKRAFMYKYAEGTGIKYSLIIDADELYKRDEFILMMEYLSDKDFEISYIKSIDYYKDEYHYITDTPHYMPFISKSGISLSPRGSSPVCVDPTRILKSDKCIVMPLSYRMHHLSYIINPRDKIKNYSQKWLFSRDTDTETEFVINEIVSAWENFNGTDGINLAG